MRKGFGERLREFFRSVQDERDRYREAYLRARADLENFKREAKRQAEEKERAGAERLILSLLPAIDNMDRTLAYGEGEPDPEALLRGVAMVREELVESLRAAGLERIEPLPGQDFDPGVMEAAEVKGQGDAGVVAETLRPGYAFRGRVLRPARVVVERKQEKPETEDVNKEA